MQIDGEPACKCGNLCKYDDQMHQKQMLRCCLAMSRQRLPLMRQLAATQKSLIIFLVRTSSLSRRQRMRKQSS